MMEFLLACENGLCQANRVWLVALVADEAVAEEGSENIPQFCRLAPAGGGTKP
jgi:hypothetical protein